MVQYRKGFVYEKATALERMYWTRHIPQRYWNVKPENISFKGCAYKRKDMQLKVPPEPQVEYFSQVMETIKTQQSIAEFAGQFLCVGSTPSEDLALSVGFLFATRLLQRNPSAEVSVIDLSGFYDVDRNIAPELTIIHNLTSDSTRERIQLARDYIKWALKYSFCVLCCSGRQPLEFSLDVLQIPANMVIYGEDEATNLQREY